MLMDKRFRTLHKLAVAEPSSLLCQFADCLVGDAEPLCNGRGRDSIRHSQSPLTYPTALPHY
jgi:hypothetical protein